MPPPTEAGGYHPRFDSPAVGGDKLGFRVRSSMSLRASSWTAAAAALAVSDVDPDDDDAAEGGAAKDRKAKAPKPIVIQRHQFRRDTEGYLREVRSQVNVFDVATKSSVAVTSGPYDDADAAWSPDGK